ncbi:hypothetical protein NHX12_007908 [Muraenolepis orangiensis]|uniref:Leucine-rich repeat protein (LRRP) n=1 Tax=Muraenolepis orangiensis TaxID=630683 RepID=A0A9Q0DLW5_9TELE|nr:hypothetical protein NHX12_007908 [Muraenolepis orangiensis]
MSAGALYKLGDGKGHRSNCFPVSRAFFRHREDGVGHWLVAHRESVEQRRRDIRRTETDRPEHSGGSDCATTPAPGNTLDGALLVRLHGVETPSDLCSIDISEQRLHAVKHEDLKEFDHVVYIHAWDNSLAIESFRSFKLLRELDLSLNGCCAMRFDPEDFPHLEVLDLSYNNVSEGDIVCIGRLVGLKALCLTGNRLRQLPANMAGSNQTPTDTQRSRFGVLETLTLDDNRLTSDVFHSLAHLTRLQSLNLQGNNISEVSFPLPHRDPSVDEVVGSGLLLPQLRYLNLAHNKMADEEALLAAALLPSLTELVIHNNPLTTQRTGDPPLVKYLLSAGVQVKRTDRPVVERPSVMLPAGGLKHKEARVEERETNHTGDGVTDHADEANRQAESFFPTQPEDQTTENNRRSNAAASEEESKDYNVLMDKNSRSEGAVVATGIQTTVRMLEQTLKTLIVCRDVRTKPQQQTHTSPENRKSTKAQGEKAEDIRNVPPSSVLDGQPVNQQD